jgi:hypothetical protein
MGGLGSTMSRQPVRIMTVVLWLGLLTGPAMMAGGLYLGVPVYTLDLSIALTQLPLAADAAFDILEAMAIDLGVSPSQVAELRSRFEEALAGVESFASGLPSWIPVPLVGGGVEVGLPLGLIDGVRVTGGWLSEDLARSVARAAGVDIPQPLADFTLDIGTSQGHVAADLTFSAWGFSTEAIKRWDLLILALNFGAGIDLFGGVIRPQIVVELPPDMIDGATSALGALHLDEMTWSGFAVHGMMGFELGPPFFRLYGDLRWTIAVSQDENWWGLRPGPLSALLGFVIRF